MTRGAKILVVILIILVGILASTSGFFYAKSMNLEKQTQGNTNALSSTDQDASGEASAIDTTTANGAAVTASSAVTQPATAGSRPSAPADTYTVASGDTLSIIAAKLDMSWPDLAEANGLTAEDANKIKVGQALIVPKNNQISYIVNTAKAQEIQTKVDGGKDTFRLSAADTAKSDAPSAYGLVVTDIFAQKTIDTTMGTATVTATHNGKIYEIKLTQPVTKGDKGIWAISTIKLSK